MNKAKVSVVVPAYNAENYLEKCVDSLLAQTLEEIEIIVVNDGSKDKTREMLDKYQEQYPDRMKVFHKENGGQSDARNYGIQRATGEYIGFVDSDDWIEKDMYRLMYEKAQEKSYDVVVCDFAEIRDGKAINYTSGVEMDGEGIDYMKKSMLEIYSSPWNKIYKRELVAEHLFKHGVWYEDVEFLYRMIPKINSIGVVRQNLYNYLIRKGSVSNTTHVKIYDQLENWNGLVAYYKEQGFYEEYKAEIEYCYVRYIYALFIKSMASFGKTEFKKAVKDAVKNVNQTFPDYKNNYYLKHGGLKAFYLRNFNSLFADLIYIKFHNA